MQRNRGPQFLQALCHFSLHAILADTAVCTQLKRRKAFRAGKVRPFGTLAQSKTGLSGLRLRGTLRISVTAKCFYSTVSTRSRRPFNPASTSVPRSQGRPSRPRPRRPSAQTLRRQSQSVHPHQTTSVANAPLASLVPRPMALPDSWPAT